MADVSVVEERLDSAHTDVAAQIVRGDAKAGMLLPLFGAALAGVVALATRPVPFAAELLLWVASVPALAAVVLLLNVVRPRFGRDDDYGFVFLSGFAGRPSELLAALAEQPGEMAKAVDTVRLALIADSKYRRVRTAVDCLTLALLLVAAALVSVAVA
ncbi:hypothetical protein ADK67_05465 [Saccharothrix sp. NRRL B-16348]|uniref:Pycsar system effector family protein n=1 Tax=Saccharothrix sp. NRRL B-16348 TaxID=1415542 RepID=UPI0006AFF478|nr:Pycsar system effector family protein [Saccharothrix sp. NRRL B-16348]KOX33786.1 hypothetical protein ADK67_05465 [Saccharothrix sp. NRRL B-16348]